MATTYNHYETLGLRSDATIDQVKRAYRTLAHRHHPDKPGGDTVTFQAVHRAYIDLIEDRQSINQPHPSRRPATPSRPQSYRYTRVTRSGSGSIVRVRPGLRFGIQLISVGLGVLLFVTTVTNLPTDHSIRESLNTLAQHIAPTPDPTLLDL